MKMKPKKLRLPLKFLSPNNKQLSFAVHTRLNKKGIIDVLKLNINTDFYKNNNLLTKPTDINENATIVPSKKNFSLEKDKDYFSGGENENINLATLLISMKKLKSFYPNINNLISSDRYASGSTASRAEHIKFEELLKKKINSIKIQENAILYKKEKLEKKILSMDDIISDEQLNVVVINNLEKNNPKLTKNFEENYFKKECKDGNKRHRRSSIMISPDYQYKLKTFLARASYNAKQKIQTIENKIYSDKNTKKKLTKDMNILLIELKEIHTKKKNLITKLYNHFLEILHEGKDSRNEGLSWIIREIFYLGKNVLKSNFPEYLDRNCIKYLYKIAGINMQIIDTEKKMKILKEEFKKKTNSLKNLINKYRRTSILNNPMNFNSSKSNDDIKLYLAPVNSNKSINSNKYCNKPIRTNYSMDQKELNKRSSLKDIINHNIHVYSQKNFEVTLPFLCNDPNQNVRGNKSPRAMGLYGSSGTEVNIPEVIKIKDMEKLTEMNKNRNLINFEKNKEINNYYVICKKLRELKLEKEKLKTEEMDRIFREFQKNNYAQKYFIDKNTVISALIGEDNLDAELIRQSKREKQFLEELAKGKLHKKVYSVKEMINSYNINDN